jgi:hypothetical protein
MNFKTFLEIIQRKVNESLPGNLRAELKAVQKNNGTVYTGLTLTGVEAYSHSDVVASPIVYLEEFYRRYMRQHEVCGDGEQCGMAEYCPAKTDAAEGRLRDEERSVYPCINAFGKAIAEILVTYMNEAPEISDVSDYDAVKDRLFVQLVGRDANASRLEDAAKHEYLDMTVIYYLLCEGPDKDTGGVRVTWDMLGDWGIAEDLLYRDAIENTRKMMGEKLLRFDQDPEQSGLDTSESRMMILSNEKNFFGASVLLYSEELGKIAEEFQRDLYVLPSSIHEVILLPESGQDPEALRATVRRVNETEVRKEEVLTDSVYLYDRERGEVRIA